MPAVRPLKLTPNQRVVTQPRQSVGVGDRIDVHTILGEGCIQSVVCGVPEERSRTDEGHGRWLAESLPPFCEPIKDLARFGELSTWHDGKPSSEAYGS